MLQSTTPAPPKTNGTVSGRFRIVEPGDVWEHVLPGLTECYNAHELRNWDIEGVRDLLDDGSYMLIVDSADPRDFAIVRLNESPYHDDDMEMFVLLAYHKHNEFKTEFGPQLEIIARVAGAKHIRFYSRRRGMLRHAMSAGFTPLAIEYVKEL